MLCYLSATVAAGHMSRQVVQLQTCEAAFRASQLQKLRVCGESRALTVDDGAEILECLPAVITLGINGRA